MARLIVHARAQLVYSHDTPLPAGQLITVAFLVEVRTRTGIAIEGLKTADIRVLGCGFQGGDLGALTVVAQPGLPGCYEVTTKTPAGIVGQLAFAIRAEHGGELGIAFCDLVVPRWHGAVA